MVLEFWKRIKSSLNEIGRKYKLYVLSVIAALVFVAGIVVGLFTFAEMDLTNSERAWYIILSIGGLMSLPFIVIKKIYELEIAERQFVLADNEAKNRTLDKDYLGNELVSFLKYRLSTKLKFRDIEYEERANHYRTEKAKLAKAVVTVLEQRLKYLADHKKINRVRVILDAGTTISPVFEELGWLAKKSEGDWISKLDIYTNNVRGLQILFSLNDKNEDDRQADRYQDIPVKCKVLPGSILSAYQAIADESTVNRVLGFNSEPDCRDDNSYVIGITTGNYVLFDHDKMEVLPIAKIGHHPHIKAAMYHVSNEIFLIAPLGKVLRVENDEDIRTTLSNLNKDFGYKQNAANEAEKPYRLVEPEILSDLEYACEDTISLWNRKTVLFTTSRKEGAMLSHHAEKLNVLIKYKPDATDPNGNGTRGYIKSELFEYYPPIYTKDEEREQEVPHENMRAFVEKYFWLTKQKVDSQKNDSVNGA